MFAFRSNPSPSHPIASTQIRALAPGLLLAGAVALVSLIVARIEAAVFGRAAIEALVIAILIGAAVRSLAPATARARSGIDFSAKVLLEIAVVLLGLSVDRAAVAGLGPSIIGIIALLVAVVLLTSYGIGRVLGLPHRLALLVACGNSICGNSAIAAAAPVIRAESEHVASAIAFTAVLGVAVVLALPLTITLWHLSATQYGLLAGLTVYAVPQVIAATAPVGAVALQVGTLVKLMRVLMLGPVVFVLSLITARLDGATGRHPGHSVPWFIIGFVALALLRASGIVPQVAQDWAAYAAGALTVIAMAALGLSVDVRSVAAAGARVTAAVVLSLAVLTALSLVVVKLVG